MAWDWSSLLKASNNPTKGIHLSSRDASGAKGSFSAVPFPRQRHRASSTKPPRKGQYRLPNCVLNLCRRRRQVRDNYTSCMVWIRRSYYCKLSVQPQEIVCGGKNPTAHVE